MRSKVHDGLQDVLTPRTLDGVGAREEIWTRESSGRKMSLGLGERFVNADLLVSVTLSYDEFHRHQTRVVMSVQHFIHGASQKFGHTNSFKGCSAL